MDYEQMKQIIKTARLGAPNQESMLLIEGFEEFIELVEEVNRFTDPKDIYARVPQVEAARDKVWSLLEQTAASFGFTMPDFMKFMESSQNFSADQWRAMETLKKMASQEKQGEMAVMKRQKRNRYALKA
jgi:hypothetical protein